MKTCRPLLIFLFLAPLHPEKLADLPDLENPVSIAAADSILYVCDRDCIRCYSLKPFQHIKKIGRGGEGPGEFNSPPHLTVLPERIFVNTMGKVMSLTKTGEFLSQIKIPFIYWYIYYPMMPASPNYVGLPLKRIEETNTHIHTVNLYDPDFKLIKEIHQGGSPQLLPPPRPGTKVAKQDYEVIPDSLEVAVQGNRIYVADSRKGFFITVFESNGRHLFDIERSYQKVRVPDKFKKDFWNDIRSDKDWEQQKNRYNYIIKDYYPAFFSMKIQQRKIYLSTCSREDTQYEVVVLDLDGKLLKKTFAFPLSPENRLLRGIAPFSNEYAVYNDKIYYILFDEHSMLYELHISEI
jgi:hypothetical protein